MKSAVCLSYVWHGYIDAAKKEEKMLESIKKTEFACDHNVSANDITTSKLTASFSRKTNSLLLAVRLYLFDKTIK